MLRLGVAYRVLGTCALPTLPTLPTKTLEYNVAMRLTSAVLTAAKMCGVYAVQFFKADRQADHHQHAHCKPGGRVQRIQVCSKYYSTGSVPVCMGLAATIC